MEDDLYEVLRRRYERDGSHRDEDMGVQVSFWYIAKDMVGLDGLRTVIMVSGGARLSNCLKGQAKPSAVCMPVQDLNNSVKRGSKHYIVLLSLEMRHCPQSEGHRNGSRQ